MRKATVITQGWAQYGHTFSAGTEVMQVSKSYDEDGHLLFRDALGNEQYLEDADFEYNEEEN